MSESDFKEWLLHPVTVEFRKAMSNRREELKEDLAEGAFTTETVDGTAQQTAKAIGQIQMLKDLLETTYKNVTEDASNVK
jgi:Sec-independent protein translocase protein TatA